MVKPASGIFIQPVSDSNEAAAGRTPQWQRVCRAVRSAISGRALPPGARLPSARQLARDWRVARGAVDEAYAQLQLEGLIQRRVGDGTYVSDRPAQDTVAPRPEPAPLAQRVLDHAQTLNRAPVRADCTYVARRAPTLHPRATDIDGFPLALWRRLVLAAHGPAHRPALAESPAAGLRVLREALARHLAQQRGLACTADQVLVMASPAEAMNLLVRVLLRQGDRVWVEDPSHSSLPWLLRTLAVDPVGVPLDDEGFDTAAARRMCPDARMVYLHPLNQYPLGQRTSTARGDALLAWARERGSWVVEAMFNDELWPREMQPMALARREPERVIALCDFEGVMFPSQRLACLVLPPALVAPLNKAQELWGPRVVAATQMAMAEFIDRGHMQQHLDRQRARLARRRELLRTVLGQRLPAAVTPGPLTPAPHWCLHWSDRTPDVEVVQKLRAAGIVTVALSPLAMRPRSCNGLVFGYADWSDEHLCAALDRLAQTLQAVFPSRRQPRLAA